MEQIGKFNTKKLLPLFFFLLLALVGCSGSSTQSPTTNMKSTSTTDRIDEILILHDENKGNRTIDDMNMLYLPPASFMMGADVNDQDAEEGEKPRHKVNLDAYWFDETEISSGRDHRGIVCTEF